MTPHPDAEQLAAYPVGGLDPAEASRLEAHVESCSHCQMAVAAAVPRERLDRVWMEVVDVVDAPPPLLLERLLVRVGIPEDRARLLAITPSAHGSWLMAVSLTTLFAIAAAGRTDVRQVSFLILAPLIPLLGVHLAYSTAVDPTHELTAATPRTGLSLVLQRSLLVLGGTTIVLAAMGLVLPIPVWSAVGWLLPALAMTGLSLALSAVMPASWAFGGVAATWTGLLLVLPAGGGDRMAAFGPTGQLVWAVVLLATLVVLLTGRRSPAVGNRWPVG